ncbi:MAG TPA: histidine phosphatase family protein [Gaiellaceae bacterium]
MTTIYLARHGESDWNAENRFQGHTDRPLTELGRRQAELLAGEVAGLPLAAVYTSPLRRCTETAEIVAGPLGVERIVEPALCEVDVGSWAGLTRAEVEERFPEGFRSWITGGNGWEDGETYEQMSERVLAALRAIAGRHRNDQVLVVSHGGPIRAIHAAADGVGVQEYRRVRPVEPNARLSAVAVENGRIARLG